MDNNDMPVRGTRPLSDIYERAEVAAVEPSSFEEAEAHQGWKQAMINEMSMIDKNQTWELVARPANRKVIGMKWVFRAKHNVDGSLNKLKSWLVVKGFSKKYGIDYFETFPPVARLDIIRLLVALAAQKQWKIHQLDPKGFKVAGKEDSVYKLKKALYGLKEELRAWYERIDKCLASLGFERSISEPTLYVKKKGDETQLIVSLYMDDLLVIGGNNRMLADFKGKMEQMFEMSDLGQMSYFLGIEVSQIQQGIFLSQKAFFLMILNKFSMPNYKATTTLVAVGEKLSSQGDFEKVDDTTYRSLVGCLLNLTATRPDIMFTVSLLSRFMHCCNVKHLQAAKRVLRYIKGTLSFEMKFTKVKSMKLLGYADSDWTRLIDDKKSTSSYLFTIGSAIFCWSSKKQNVVAQSTGEAESMQVSSLEAQVFVDFFHPSFLVPSLCLEVIELEVKNALDGMSQLKAPGVHGLHVKFFPSQWAIIGSSVHYVTGNVTPDFKPTRRVDQGDPLSPYLFVLRMERLGHCIQQARDEGKWQPLRLSNNGPGLTHLFFADDLVYFYRAKMDHTNVVKDIIMQFCYFSRHKCVRDLPREVIRYITGIIPPRDDARVDQIGWKLMENGKCTMSSGYRKVTQDV
ncbi:hypothetical protein CXB51_010608 [Gossypium anomalum]|uniref:Reverse transcriptase Ty1/copia-type domain-containing protein n=1 Tax=Gossypium anomalum TaxID=47600 RepID=A0A8J6D322_9ROSI|nr:hypothetical protein CXB51_010608 [Gossypium anomalum]